MTEMAVTRAEAQLFFAVGVGFSAAAIYTLDANGWMWPLMTAGAVMAFYGAWSSWRLSRDLRTKWGQAIAQAQRMRWVREGKTPEEIRARKARVDEMEDDDSLHGSSMPSVGLSGATLIAGTQIDTLGNISSSADHFTARNSADDTMSFVSDAYSSPVDRY